MPVLQTEAQNTGITQLSRTKSPTHNELRKKRPIW